MRNGEKEVQPQQPIPPMSQQATGSRNLHDMIVVVSLLEMQNTTTANHFSLWQISVAYAHHRAQISPFCCIVVILVSNGCLRPADSICTLGNQLISSRGAHFVVLIST
jgi:hypothetical protein